LPVNLGVRLLLAKRYFQLLRIEAANTNESIMSTKFFRLTSILVAAFAALAAIENSANAFVIFDSKGKSPSATDPVPVPAFAAIAASNGVFYHNSDNGHISYCSNTTDPPQRSSQMGHVRQSDQLKKATQASVTQLWKARFSS
jgi:hypothetical protein